jgi:hypothetical protein
VARVKPNLCSAISGRLGGIEFAMAREGIVVKRRKPPRQLNHVKQVEARTVFHQRVADWHAMTPEAMLEWTAWANTHPVTNRLGETRYLSGYNWFLKGRDSEDGILLPLGITPPVTNLQAIVVEGVEDVFLFDFPAGCEDETVVTVCFFEYPYELNFDWPSATAAWMLEYTKATIGDLDYAHLSALGVLFHAGHNYEIRIWIQRPRYFISNFARQVFPCVPAQQWAWHLAMDDDAPDTDVADDWMHYAQTFEGNNPNTEDHHVAGVHDGALHFDGATDHIDLTPESYEGYLDVNQPFTLAIWWKPDAPMPAAYKEFLGNYSFFKPGISFSIKNNSSRLHVQIYDGGVPYTITALWAEADNNAWRHFALVRNGTNLRTFRNGILNTDDTSVHFVGACFEAGTPLSIGAQRGVTAWAAGAADDVYLFNRALSDAEVADLAVP